MLTIDHLKLIRRDVQEVKKFRDYLLGCQQGVLSEYLVTHENDSSCCRQEHWDATYKAIHDAVKPQTNIVPINIEHRRD